MNRIKKIQNKKYNNNEFITNDKNSNCNKTNSLEQYFIKKKNRNYY